MAVSDKECFGFYSSGPTCQICHISKRCKAIVITHGFHLVGETLRHMIETLPEGTYRSDDTITELFDQLTNPPEDGEGDAELTKIEEDFMDLI